MMSQEKVRAEAARKESGSGSRITEALKEASSESITFLPSLTQKEHNQNTVPIAALSWKGKKKKEERNMSLGLALQFESQECIRNSSCCLLSKDALLKLDSSLPIYCVPPFLVTQRSEVSNALRSERKIDPQMPSIMLKACVTSCGAGGVVTIYYRGRVRTSDSLSPGLFVILRVQQAGAKKGQVQRSLKGLLGSYESHSGQELCKSPQGHQKENGWSHFLLPDSALRLPHRHKNCFFFPRVKIPNIY